MAGVMGADGRAPCLLALHGASTAWSFEATRVHGAHVLDITSRMVDHAPPFPHASCACAHAGMLEGRRSAAQGSITMHRQRRLTKEKDALLVGVRMQVDVEVQ